MLSFLLEITVGFRSRVVVSDQIFFSSTLSLCHCAGSSVTNRKQGSHPLLCSLIPGTSLPSLCSWSRYGNSSL